MSTQSQGSSRSGDTFKCDFNSQSNLHLFSSPSSDVEGTHTSLDGDNRSEVTLSFADAGSKAYLTATFDMSSGVSKKESMKAAMSKVTYETGSAAPSSTGSSGTKTYGPDSLTGVLTEGIEGVVEDDDFEEHGQFLLEEFEKEYQNKLGKAYDHIQKAHCTAQGSRAG